MVMPELSIIKHFLQYEKWLKYNSYINRKEFPKELNFILTLFDKHYSEYHDNLTIEDLANLIAASAVKDSDYYKELLSCLESLSVSDTTTEVLLESYYRQRLLKEISLSAYEVTEGKKDYDSFAKLLEQLSKPQEIVSDDVEFVTDDLETLLNETFRKKGLRWRLSTLNKMLGSLRAGDFGFIFARPETGKTTFLASETTYMAQQLSEEDGPILWFN